MTIPTPKVHNDSRKFVAALETTVNFSKEVSLTCQMMYNNTNYNIDNKFEIVLSWRKRTNPNLQIVAKELHYKSGSNMEEIKHEFTVLKSSDGGEYYCEAELSVSTTSDEDKKQHVTRTANITVKSKYIN